MVIATVAAFGLISSSEAGEGFPPVGIPITMERNYHCVTADGLVIPYKYICVIPNLMGDGYMLLEYYAPEPLFFSCEVGHCVMPEDYCGCRDLEPNYGPYPIK